MKEKLASQTAIMACVAGVFLCSNQTSNGAESPETEKQIQLLQQQNEALQQQLHKQQELIDSLTHKVSEIQEATASRDRQLEALKEDKDKDDGSPGSANGFKLGKVNISGEGAVAFFRSEANGQNPNGEFRIDEAKIFIEAPIWKEVYFFSELNLATREGEDLDLKLGELYLDFENVSQLWNRDRQLNLRFGRFYIPFGEEYLYRYAIDDPLISHSLMDIWGVDEGVEAYGSFGKLAYVVAVQNGGVDTVHDFTSDKSVAGRLSYDANKWLRVSVSGMRTGDLDAVDEGLSELWFGNGWIRSIGSPATTTFHANLVEGDVQLNLPWLYLKGTGGYIRYDDNDPGRNNQRNVYYYSVEGVRNITRKFYGAARFSQILAPEGFPIVGNAPIGTFFNPFQPLTTDYWRLSLGAGYRFSPNLIAKGEYSFNQGKTVGGGKRTQENVFAVQAAYRF